MDVKLMLAALAFGASHCNQDSVYPVYEPGDLVTEPRLTGAWISEDNERFVVRVAGPTKYALCVVEEHDTTRFDLHLARAEGLLFVDLVRSDVPDQTLPLHEYAIVAEIDSVLIYWSLSDDWLKTYVRANPGALSHLKVDGQMLITAAPRELQGFVVRHRHDAGATDRQTLRRVPADAMGRGC